MKYKPTTDQVIETGSEASSLLCSHHWQSRSTNMINNFINVRHRRRFLFDISGRKQKLP